MMYHNPVMLNQCIDGLAIKPNGTYVDLTYGGGGHSTKIMAKLKTGKLFGFDQDEDANHNAINDERFVMVNENFRFVKNCLNLHHAIPVDGILADLGVSSHQLDDEKRGFSTRSNGDLDMRMNQTSSLTAKEILNTYSEAELKTIFQEYGEVQISGRLATLIVKERAIKLFTKIDQFKQTIKGLVPSIKENKFFAQVFQALRIAVNDELGALKEMLLQTIDILAPQGRLVIISYHSLEDRLVKNFLRSGNFTGEIEKDFYGNPQVPFKLICRKPITPTTQEINENSRSRSAKLRIAEKV